MQIFAMSESRGAASKTAKKRSVPSSNTVPLCATTHYYRVQHGHLQTFSISASHCGDMGVQNATTSFLEQTKSHDNHRYHQENMMFLPDMLQYLFTSGTFGIIHCGFSIPGLSFVYSDRLADTGTSFDSTLRKNSTVFSGFKNAHLEFRATRAIYAMSSSESQWPTCHIDFKSL